VIAMNDVARVAELRCYPVKGCAGISLPAAELTPAGVTHDRSFLVVSPEGVFRTQRATQRWRRSAPTSTRRARC
jgi:hypothetical protein